MQDKAVTGGNSLGDHGGLARAHVLPELLRLWALAKDRHCEQLGGDGNPHNLQSQSRARAPPGLKEIVPQPSGRSLWLDADDAHDDALERREPPPLPEGDAGVLQAVPRLCWLATDNVLIGWKHRGSQIGRDCRALPT